MNVREELLSKETEMYLNNKRAERAKGSKLTIFPAMNRDTKWKLSGKIQKGTAIGLAVFFAASTVAACVGMHFGKKKASDMAKNQPDSHQIDPSKRRDPSDNTIKINDIKYEIPETENYSNDRTVRKVTSGNVDLGNVVRGSNGKLYASSSDLERSKIPTKKIPNSITEDGGYVVKDENGKVVSKGESSNSIPNGYHVDPKTGRIIKNNQYIDENGNVVSKDKEESTTLAVGTKVEESTTIYEKPIIIDDTYEPLDKEVVVESSTKIESTTSKPVVEETTKVESTTSKPVIEVTTKVESTTKEETTKVEPTTKEEETTKVEPTTKEEESTTLSDGTYKDANNNLWVSKAEYEKFINDVDQDLDVDENGRLFVVPQKTLTLTR